MARLRAGFEGGGKLGSCPVASRTKGLHKNSKKIIIYGNIKILLETDNLELKK